MVVALVVIGVIAAVPLTLFSLVVAGIRLQNRPILNAIRRFNRAVTNPRIMSTAGTDATSTAVIRHIGRRSGHTYETPVEAFNAPDGTVLILLPYGQSADWVRNVTAQGGAELLRAGEQLRLSHPRVVPTAEVRTQLPAKEQRMMLLFNVPECLRLTREQERA
ncbi:nitroreductase family deazaflavin-dependent oxidoreductase [Mycobacteroides immunogenum]|uniref:nitroreductase family deazaflavin-dependent oxidoreductase n=1 Tax=Mycobacteroides immunogenum TaxID=83262 RepID=UPI0025B78106|nr:nitroreductase family deazaflavin-dependent oxidoreductase [Mycobacteroides immunogenum]WJR33250.1 nitroreductase family deazaflavin-dependent oxidoreductase [Mycobacteroides immunogenum]